MKRLLVAVLTALMLVGCGDSTTEVTNVTKANPIPILSLVSPDNMQSNSNDFIIVVTGTNFVQGSVVRWNENTRATTYISPTHLQASITSNDVQNAGSVSVTIFNPLPGGGVSNSIDFIVTNPTPIIHSISPDSRLTSIDMSTDNLYIMVNGVNFIENSVVNWNGWKRLTTFISSTQLELWVTADDIKAAGSVPITVSTPAPGGGVSNTLFFTILPRRLAFTSHTDSGCKVDFYDIRGAPLFRCWSHMGWRVTRDGIGLYKEDVTVTTNGVERVAKTNEHGVWYAEVAVRRNSRNEVLYIFRDERGEIKLCANESDTPVCVTATFGKVGGPLPGL